MFKGYAIALVATLLTAVSQLLLKSGAARWKSANPLHLYLNPWTLTGYGLLFAAMVLYNYAFSQIQLKNIIFFLPITLILVVAASCWLFREKLTTEGIIGAVLVIAGLFVYSM